MSAFSKIWHRRQRYLRSGRFWLRRVGTFLSPKRAPIYGARRLEVEGSVDEAVAAWEKLSDTPQYAGAYFNLMLRRAREAVEDQDWLTAVKTYEGLLPAHGDDQRVRNGLLSAALRGARKAQAQEDPLAACRFWAAYGRVSPDRLKYARNLVMCAFPAAQRAETDGDIFEARVFWAYMLLAEPQSQVATKHLQHCMQSPVDAAKIESDEVRESWNLLRDLLPCLMVENETQSDPGNSPTLSAHRSQEA